jgi:signal transduction histidine kinase/CheY-like chemotaxis protein
MGDVSVRHAIHSATKSVLRPVRLAAATVRDRLIPVRTNIRSTRRTRLRWSLVTITVLLIFGSGWAAYFVAQQLIAVHRIASYDLGADASQGAIELFKFESMVGRVALRVPGSSPEQVYLWLAILKNRCRVLSSPAYEAYTSGHPEEDRLIDSLSETLDRVAVLVPRLEDPGVQREIFAELQPFGSQLPGFTSFIYNAVDDHIEAGLRRLSLLTFLTFGLVVVLLLVLGRLVWTVWMDDFITQETLKKNAALAEDNRSKTLMIAGVSHEVRTPLMAMLGVTEMLARTDLDSSQRDMVSTADTAGRALLLLVNGMLDFARIDAGDIPLNLTPVDVVEFMSDLVRMVRAGRRSHGVALNVFIQRDVPTSVLVDRERLATVLTNLLTNAVKFTPADGVVSLAVRRVEGESPVLTQLRFEVSDTGIGIAPDAQGRIFDTFSQADKTIVDRFGGAGLGLATCRSLVKLHGGTIGVVSEPGKGSTFWVELPLAALTAQSTLGVPQVSIIMLCGFGAAETKYDQRLKRAGASVLRIVVSPGDSPETVVELLRRDQGKQYDAIMVYEDALDIGLKCQALLSRFSQPIPVVPILRSAMLGWEHRWSCLTTIHGSDQDDAVLRVLHIIASYRMPLTAVPSPLMSEPRACRVLVADDNLTNQTIVKQFLENVGHAVDLVASGRQALRALGMEAYDLVIMDINMPDLNGLDAAKEYRRTHEGCPRIPILGLTADTSDEMAERCRQSGIDARLIKPISNEDLADEVRKWVSGGVVSA